MATAQPVYWPKEAYRHSIWGGLNIDSPQTMKMVGNCIATTWFGNLTLNTLPVELIGSVSTASES
ncbi:hypothetical protein N7455_000039 [Penicillium solitum]|uniref:uncharacterized protein n=1 Tax=Penicillium solitum TaxID=60172 RepID=UPI00183D3EA3|nr:hypothetical protein HAV15_002494 [Penicillium sp. str. \